jgi:16S rRNA (cytosine1402-N4)-methyltransferase
MREVLAHLTIKPGDTAIDFTLGCGGHFLHILRRLAGQGLAVGTDRDLEMIEIARRRIEEADDLPPTPYRLIHINFSEIDEIFSLAETESIQAGIYDLGFNSMQLTAERGLSHQVDGPLDFRFDRSEGRPASDFVNEASEGELAEVIATLGDERRWAKRIAHAITTRRIERPFERTLDLADVVTKAIPARFRTTRRPPASRTFLAIRCHVNSEIGNLKRTLDGIIPRLAKGGRVLVISFNGNEDRIVKNKFRDVAVTDRAIRDSLQKGRALEVPTYRVVTRKAIYAQDDELDKNPRSRPARLRVLERVE